MWFVWGDGDSDEGRFCHGTVTACSVVDAGAPGGEGGSDWVCVEIARSILLHVWVHVVCGQRYKVFVLVIWMAASASIKRVYMHI